jgi:hypothetical protein
MQIDALSIIIGRNTRFIIKAAQDLRSAIKLRHVNCQTR